MFGFLSGERTQKNQQHHKFTLLFWVCIAAVGICKALNPKVIISGEIQTIGQDTGEIFVFLVDEACFKTPLTGIDTAIVKPINRLAYFKFEPQVTIIYGILYFHDVNNNGTLDKRMFCPVKPYGFSWNSGRKFPFDFSEISFNAHTNTYITIKMED